MVTPTSDRCRRGKPGVKILGLKWFIKKKYIGVEVINTIEPALMGTPQKEPRNIYKETKKCKMGNRQKENR